LRSLPVCPYAQTESDKDHGIKFVEDEEHSVNMFAEGKGTNCSKDLGAHGSQKDHDHSNLKEVDTERRLNGHIPEKELSDNNSLEELNDHSNLKEVDTYSIEKELDANKSLKELDGPGSEKEAGDDNCPEELNNRIDLNDLDSCITDKELNKNHSSQREPDGIASSKFAAEETQCHMELNGFNSLNLDDHNSLEELNNHNCPKESDDKNGSEELENRISKVSGDFLAEHFNNIRISGKEALVTTPETAPVKESLALPSKDDSDKAVPAEHGIDFQMVVTL
jgi:hypothetical protein